MCQTCLYDESTKLWCLLSWIAILPFLSAGLSGIMCVLCVFGTIHKTRHDTQNTEGPRSGGPFCTSFCMGPSLCFALRFAFLQSVGVQSTLHFAPLHKGQSALHNFTQKSPCVAFGAKSTKNCLFAACRMHATASSYSLALVAKKSEVNLSIN